MREYFLEDVMHPKGGIWIKCKNDKDCVFCEHCTDVYWDYTHLIYAISCEEGHDPNDRPCKYFKEEGGENDMGVKEMLDRLYAYKNGAEDENLIDDVIQLIIDLDRLTWKAPSGATWNVGASNGWKGE